MTEIVTIYDDNGDEIGTFVVEYTRTADHHTELEGHLRFTEYEDNIIRIYDCNGKEVPSNSQYYEQIVEAFYNRI